MEKHESICVEHIKKEYKKGRPIKSLKIKL